VPCRARCPAFNQFVPNPKANSMKKTFKLHVEGKNNDRVLDAIKHEIRKYVKR
jgi:hypothetical protein